jgi:hypothetical protein
MSKIFLGILIICSTANHVAAQTITKIYGFWHANHVGNIPKLPPGEEAGTGNGNNPAETAKRPNSYYVFIESSTSRAPVIEWIYVQDKRYKTSVVKLQQLPAIYEYFDGISSKKITLVPKGRKHVFVVALIAPDGYIAYQSGVSNDIVVRYRNGKKGKTAVLKKMINLPSTVVQ